MKFICKVIGHKWRPSRFVEALFAGMLLSLTCVKLSGFVCTRCGETGLA